MSSSPKRHPSIRVWRRLIPRRLQDSWAERLLWAGPAKTVWEDLKSGKSTRITIYDLSPEEGETLVSQFGGEIRMLRPQTWLKSQERKFCLTVSPHVNIVSPGSRPPARGESLPCITIPASMAFGSGEHPTTRMCLRQALRLAPPEGGMVADLGTGSGILALALSLVGHQVEAIDFDPEAIRAARSNAAMNPHVPEVDWRVMPVVRWRPARKCHLIVANLFAGILTAQMSRIAGGLRKNGKFVLSGILHDQEDDVRQALDLTGLHVDRRFRVGKWIALTGRA